MKRDWLLPIGSLIQFALLLPLARWAHKYQQPLSELVVTRLRQRKQTSATRSVVNVLNTLKGISRKPLVSGTGPAAARKHFDGFLTSARLSPWNLTPRGHAIDDAAKIVGQHLGNHLLGKRPKFIFGQQAHFQKKGLRQLVGREPVLNPGIAVL